MAVDYDLVVIGSTAAGVAAAVMAAKLKARVALVEQGVTAAKATGYINSHVLTEFAHMMQQVRWAEQRGCGKLVNPETMNAPGQLWQQATCWADTVKRKLDHARSPDVLSQLGIEVIRGDGEFYRKPTPGFAVNGRRLRSRAYLLAIAYDPVLPSIDGLPSTDDLTVETALEQVNLLDAFNHLVIIGSDPTSVALTQGLSRLGLQVMLVVPHSQILPTEDPETAYRLQAHLEAEGIAVLTSSNVTQIRQIDGKTWVQIGNQAIETDKVLLASGWQPHIADLNLEAMDVQVAPEGIICNQKLQTTNARIYTCTTPDSHLQPHLDVQRAKVAVNNALFFPISKFTSRPLPRVVNTDPQLASLGMVEATALEQYGKDVLVVRSPLGTLSKAWITGAETGFGKFIVHRDGTILGAHILAPQASEMIGIIALAMQKKLKMQALADLTSPSPSFAMLIQEIAQEWQDWRWQKRPRLQDLLEWSFDVRRSW